MPGGKIQLTVRNAQDKLLTGNPDISFFKSVFKRYTDFQTESMRLDANTDNVKLFQSKTSTLKFKINNNNGDLINHLYLNLQMPTIYSDKASSPTAANHAGRYEFQWIKRLGEYIIKDCKFIIDGEVIDNLTGEWLHIWSELTIMSNKWGGYNEMIGHEEEMFNPKSKSKLDNYPNAVDINPGDGKFYSHSIRGRRIVIPLPFWFTHNLAQAFPTYLLEGQEIELEITLRPLNELYTLLDQNIDLDTKRRFKPSTNSHKIGHFINRKGNFDQSLNDDTVGGAIGVIPFLEIGVVYLGGEERAQLQKYMKQEYLITQVAKKPYKIKIPDNINTFKHEIGLTLEYPTSKIAFCARRSDFESEYLQYENYTNKVSGIDPFAAYNSGGDMNPFDKYSIQQLGDTKSGGAGDQFGYSVAMNGDGTKIAVLAYKETFENSGREDGVVTVYNLVDGVWTQVGTKINCNIDNDNEINVSNGKGIDMSDDGSKIVVGFPNADVGGVGTKKGKVIVYVLNNNSWDAGNPLNGATNDEVFGNAVAISGDGTRFAGGTTSGNGIFRVGDTSDSSQVGANIVIGIAVLHFIDISLNTDGSIIAIGACANNSTSIVKIYKYDGGWNLDKTFTTTDNNTYLGFSVSLNGDGTIVAYSEPRLPNQLPGIVSVNEYINGEWSQKGSDIKAISVLAVGYFFGNTISLNKSGNVLAVNSNEGYTHIYTYKNNEWELLSDFIIINKSISVNIFGRSISINDSGDTIVIGMPNNDDNGTNSGQVKVFTITPPTTITTTTLNNQKFGENILSAELYFRGIKRFEKQDMSSFSLINNYQHSIRIPIDGVYTYSFETQNLFRKYQPNGACDMSMLMSTDSKNEIIQNNNRQQNRLELTLAPKITTNGDYHYNFMLFSMNYNIMRIGGGRAELLFNDSIYRDSNHHKSLKTVRDLID